MDITLNTAAQRLLDADNISIEKRMKPLSGEVVSIF